MKIAVYPGSFNPMHEGHLDIINKTLMVFDKVVVAIGNNAEKPQCDLENRADRVNMDILETDIIKDSDKNRVSVDMFSGLLSSYVKNKAKPSAIVRGLRSGYDLSAETNMQYWNEDLEIGVPFVYFITDRKYSHISSSAIRQYIEASKNDKPDEFYFE